MIYNDGIYSWLFRYADRRELLLELEIKRAQLEIEVLEAKKINLQEQSSNNKLWEQVLVGQLQNQVALEVIASGTVN
jgi:hypothetical protein